jgi:hypothetical protein
MTDLADEPAGEGSGAGAARAKGQSREGSGG